MNVRMWFVRCQQYAAMLLLFLLVGGFIVAGSSVAIAEDDLFEALGIAKISEPLEVADLSLSSIDGGEKALSEFAGKVILLNFWTTW